MDEFTYVVERFDVSGESEQLIERAELVREGEDLVCLVQGEDPRVLGYDDVPSAIASETVLSSIRANQITKITAVGSAYEDLPFILQIPGNIEDFDSTLWSAILADDHTSTSWSTLLADDQTSNWAHEQRVFRVAYVNDRRWCAYPTDNQGPRMLREARLWPGVLFEPRWGCLFVTDKHREDVFKIGLMTEGTVVATSRVHEPVDSHSVDLWKRPTDGYTDASMVVEWLLEWIPKQLGLVDDVYRKAMAQLLIEVAVRGRSGIGFPVTYLAAGNADGLVDGKDAVWKLELSLPAAILAELTGLVSERDAAMLSLVTAATDPDSLERESRRTALENMGQWALDMDEPAVPEIAPNDADDEVDEFDEDDPDAPWNRDPGELLPAKIEPGTIRLKFWKSDFNGGWHVYDFEFTWDGGHQADWYYDISMENEGLSVMSSAPSGGTAAWGNGRDVEITYSCAEFDLEGDVIFEQAAPQGGSQDSPRTWVSLGSKIAGFIDGLIE